MQIRCPKCENVYQVQKEMIPEKGRKVRCSNCNEVFLCMPSDLEENPVIETPGQFVDASAPFDGQPKPETPEQQVQEEAEKVAEEIVAEAEKASTPQEIKVENDISDIFKRLNEQTDDLFKKEQEQPVQKKIWSRIRRAGLMSCATRRYLMFLFVLFSLLLLYYFRYEIVRAIPVMEKAYAAIGIKSRILGEGLEFVNINRRDFEEDYVTKMEIKGFIANQSARTIEVPNLHLEVLDKNGDRIQSQEAVAPVVKIEPGNRVPFSIIITKPSPLSKYIYMTFTENYVAPQAVVSNIK